MTNIIYHHKDFIFNKYHKWYFNIIIKAQSQHRKKGDAVYYDNHHIIPKSMSGPNSKDNLVLLTAKEHYMVHLILPKMCVVGSKSYTKMTYALSSFNTNRNGQVYNSRLYESFKNNYFKNCSGKNHYMSGRTFSKNHKSKLSSSKIGANNPQFKGWYITPWGKFESSPIARAAINNMVSAYSIKTWCKHNRTINKQIISQCDWLKSLPESPIGVTFADLGFGFETSSPHMG